MLLMYYKIIIDTFDTHYDVKMKESIITKHRKNKFIGGKMVYTPNDDYRYNII